MSANKENFDQLLRLSSKRAENVSIYFTKSQWDEMGDYERERCRNRLQIHYISLATVQVPDKPDFMLAAEKRWARERQAQTKKIKSIPHKQEITKAPTPSSTRYPRRARKAVEPVSVNMADVFSCSQCDKTFANDQALREHIRKEHEGRKFPCSVCDHVAKNKSHLRKHERVHATRERRDHVCPHCDKAFNDASNLENHVRIHTGVKPFVCSVCAKRFVQKSALKNHQLIHSEERPFVCNECGMSFSRPYSLKKHQRTHTGEKPFECKRCPKRFSQSSHLKIHERTHSGEKPYKCQMCNYQATQSSDLRRHQRKVHNVI